MSNYAISTLKKEDSSRVFLGRTVSMHYLWTKNPGYILHFPTADEAKAFWNKMNPHFPAEMMEPVNASTIFAGNLNFAPLVKLEVKDGSNT